MKKLTMRRDRHLLIFIFALLFCISGLLLIFVFSTLLPERADEIQALGVSLFIASILAVTLDRISLNSISTELHQVMSNGITDFQVREFGIVSVTPRTSFSELQSSIENSKNLTIVQTWTPDLKGILDAAEPMVLGGGKVSIFLLHPESAFASQRSLDCGENTQNYAKGEILTNLSAIHSFFKRIQEKSNQRKKPLTLKQATSQISVKLYSSIPTCAIYQTDEKIWVALFWLKTQSANKMNFIIDGTTSNEARTHFIDQIHALDETSIKVDMTSQKLKIPELQSIPNQTVSMFKKI